MHFTIEVKQPDGTFKTLQRLVTYETRLDVATKYLNRPRRFATFDEAYLQIKAAYAYAERHRKECREAGICAHVMLDGPPFGTKDIWLGVVQR
jgi:hypothetical protein